MVITITFIEIAVKYTKLTLTVSHLAALNLWAMLFFVVVDLEKLFFKMHLRNLCM